MTSEHFVAGSIVAINSDGTVRQAGRNDAPVGVTLESRNNGAVEVMTSGLVSVEFDDGNHYTVYANNILGGDVDESGRVKVGSGVYRVAVTDKVPVVQSATKVKVFKEAEIVKKQESNREIIKKRLNAI